MPGEEEWGHRRCVLAWLGAFAQGGEGQAQERWAGVLEALPSCQCSSQDQSLGSPPSADALLPGAGSSCAKLTAQIHLLERSSRL